MELTKWGKICLLLFPGSSRLLLCVCAAGTKSMDQFTASNTYLFVLEKWELQDPIDIAGTGGRNPSPLKTDLTPCPHLEEGPGASGSCIWSLISFISLYELSTAHSHLGLDREDSYMWTGCGHQHSYCSQLFQQVPRIPLNWSVLGLAPCDANGSKCC